MKKKWKSIVVLGLTYILSVSLPIISVLCLGRMVTNSYYEKILSDKQKSIEFAFDRFQQRIDNIESLTQMVAKNDIVLEYTYASLRGSAQSIEKKMQMQEMLSSYMNNSDVTAMYFYDAMNQQIITTDAVFSDGEDYFKYKYISEQYTAREALERLDELSWGYKYYPSSKINLDGVDRQIIEYANSVPINRIKNSQPQLIVVMDVENILGDFYDVLEEGSELYIYHNQQLLFQRGEKYQDLTGSMALSGITEVENGEESVYYMAERSNDKQWRYEVYMPGLRNRISADTMTSNVWLLMSVPIIGSILICVYFTFRNHRELQDILNYNEQIKERVRAYDLRAKYEVLDRMLRDTYADKREMEQALETTDVCIGDEQCLVLCFHYDDASYRTSIADDIVLKELVKEFLIKEIDGKKEVFDISARETICVLAAADPKIEISIRNLLSRLNVEILYSYGAKISVGAGTVVDSIYQISKSYMQAKEVIKYSEISENKMLFFFELEQLQDVYYFPRETGEKIYNNVVAGRVESAQEIIREIYTANFVRNSRLLSMKAIEILKDRIRDVMLSIVEKYGIYVENPMLTHHDEQNVKRYFEVACEFAEILAEEIRKQGICQENRKVQKIRDYIQENFCDSTLSLKQISQELGLNESYISKKFKEEYGENLSGVIERLRIEKAITLMKTTELRISDIAEQVGYTSDLSFRRAFKKMTGVTPGDYRENH